jgi:uncharacterized protein YjbI with pentapeptide repeats
MTGRILPYSDRVASPPNTNLPKRQSLQKAQEIIYKFLIELVNKSSPDAVILKLKQLFVYTDEPSNSKVNQAIYEIIFNNNEEEFKNTLKRSCYILINNWISNRKYKYIQELLQLLAEAGTTRQNLSRSLNRLRSWLVNFINSEDYQELQLFASPYISHKGGYWSHRYTSYLLVPQYLDSKNPIEQREIAKNLSKWLKDKFNFELAMYIVRCESPSFKHEKPANPTKIGNEVIHLIKKVVPSHIFFNYENYAYRFTEQIKNLTYEDFKERLKEYILFSVTDSRSLKLLKTKLSEKLDDLYEIHHQEILSVDLLLRTCRRIIDFLTTEDGQQPSELFILLNSQGGTLTLVLTLLKTILICKYVRTHLEVCIAKLIRYYENYPEDECQWFIYFLEVFNIVLSIYTENVKYNLVTIKTNALGDRSVVDLDAYRVFAQLKGTDLRNIDLKGADIRSIKLSAADLRDANLSRANLSQADLSLAKLRRANLSCAMLKGTELVSADLKSADLSGASLSGAHMRRADLSHANLSRAHLIATKLHLADLHNADLSSAMLRHASLNASELSSADLRYADLQQSDLSYTNLSDANLSKANLGGADLRHTQLHQANLNGANLHHANLSEANLSGANLTEANLNSAELNNVNLNGAELNGAHLRWATLSNASLSNANLSRADLSHTDLSGCDLRGADLRNALLRHVNLKNADLSYADLRGVNLFNTELRHANVKGTQFSKNLNLYDGMKRELKQRGAIIEIDQ